MGVLSDISGVGPLKPKFIKLILGALNNATQTAMEASGLPLSFRGNTVSQPDIIEHYIREVDLPGVGRIRAIKVKPYVFEGPHPNPLHVKGVIYDPRIHTVTKSIKVDPDGEPMIKEGCVGSYVIAIHSDGEWYGIDICADPRQHLSNPDMPIYKTWSR